MKSVPTPDPDARKTDIDEISAITGWDRRTVMRAVRAGQLPGCRFLPPDDHSSSGYYLCAFRPFITWFRAGIEVGQAPPDETPRLLRTLAIRDTIDQLLAAETA